MNKPDKSNKPDQSHEEADAFERLSQSPPPGLLREFLQFIVQEKKWWMIPILLSLAIVGALVALSSSSVAPFIYTLF